MKRIQGSIDAAGLRFAVVASRFNKVEGVTERLVAGAVEALREAGASMDDVTRIDVPGAFEIPLAVRRAAASKRYDGIVALGCVTRGETPHFDYVCREAAGGVGRAAVDAGLPVAFGILTVDTEEQALARSQPGRSNRGFEAALAAVEMVNLLKQL